MTRLAKVIAFSLVGFAQLVLLLLGWAFAGKLIIAHGPSILVPFVESKVFAVFILLVSMLLVIGPLFLRIDLAPRSREKSSDRQNA